MIGKQNPGIAGREKPVIRNLGKYNRVTHIGPGPDGLVYEATGSNEASAFYIRNTALKITFSGNRSAIDTGGLFSLSTVHEIGVKKVELTGAEGEILLLQ